MAMQKDMGFVEIDDKAWAQLAIWMKLFPKETAKHIRLEWKKEATKAVRKIRSRGYKRRGTNSIGEQTREQRTKRKNQQNRRSTRLNVQQRIKVGKRKKMGGWVRVGHYEGYEIRGAAYIARFQEGGTVDRIQQRREKKDGSFTGNVLTVNYGKVPARHPFETHSKGVEVDLIKATNKAIDRIIAQGFR